MIRSQAISPGMGFEWVWKDSGLMSFCSTLPHGPEGSDVDQYIRGIRFSPDGKFLATGTEDKQIRVSSNVAPRSI